MVDVPVPSGNTADFRRWTFYLIYKTKKTAICRGFFGGDKGSRTPDLFNAIEALYQLSYIPMR